MRRQNHFQRDDARRHTLPRAIHDPHSAACHFIQQVVILNTTAARRFFCLTFFDCGRQQTRRAEASW
jgi:hypothetical protein